MILPFLLVDHKAQYHERLGGIKTGPLAFPPMVLNRRVREIRALFTPCLPQQTGRRLCFAGGGGTVRLVSELKGPDGHQPFHDQED